MANPRTRKTSADKTNEPVVDAVEIDEPTVRVDPEQVETAEAEIGAPADSPAEKPTEIAAEKPAEPEDVAEEPVALTEPAAEPTEDSANEDAGLSVEDEVADTPAAAFTPAAPASSVKPEPVVKKVGFLPVVLGGVVAAGIGAGAAIFALPQIPSQYLPASLQPAAQIDVGAIEAAIAAQAARSEALEGAIAALPSPAAAVDIAPVEDALAEANAKIEALSAQVLSVENQMAALGDRALQSDPAAAAAMQQVQAEIAQMKALIDEGRDSSTAAKAQIEAAALQAAERISGAEAEAAKLRADAEQDAAASRAQTAIAQLGVAISTGVETEAALSALTDAGLTVPEALTADVASRAALIDGFEGAAREALAVSRKATAGDSALGKVGAFLIAQTGIRSLEPQEGDDPDAVLSRAGAAVEGGKLADALAEIAKLPPEGQEAMADWVSQAQAHIAATDALGELAQSLN